MGERKKVGIVLFQLGGPDSLEAVEPFLYNLFCDPDIIEIPLGWLLRKPLARYIAWKRKDKIAHHYQEIGGRSPILPLTEAQARALEAALAPHMDARCFIAMRYWHPFTAEAIAKLLEFAPDEIVLLPLYPQYSFATTGSSLNEWERQWRRVGGRRLESRVERLESREKTGGGGVEESSELSTLNSRLSSSPSIRLIREYYDHPLYIEALADNISASLAKFASANDVTLVFSAHGLPVSFIERGDPYQKQIEETVRLVMQKGGWPNPHIICYQSKVGPQEWLAPSLDDTIHRLAHEKCKSVLVCPVAFVTEHIETLHEINIETRAEAVALGIERFEMVPSLNDSPKFIAALADLVCKSHGVSCRPQAVRP